MFHCSRGNQEKLDFSKFINVEPCAVANLLAVLIGIRVGCSVLISFQVGILIIFDSAPESFKNLFQDLVVEILYFLDFLREMELSKFFLLVVLFVYFDICGLYLSSVLRLFRVQLQC